MPLLAELASIVNGTVVGDGSVEIIRVAGVDHSGPGDLTLGGTKNALEKALNSEAAAVIVQQGTENLSKPAILVSNPRLAFSQLLAYFAPKRICVPGIHGTAVIGKGFNGPEAEIGPLVYIGDDVTVGKGSIISAGALIGVRVIIGENSFIHGNVVIREDCKIGNRVEIHPGAVIGSDGFGYVTTEGKHYKVPQLGIVVIEDEVEIGANVTIDRATTGVTLIKRGTKVDNLVQIAHNCEVGEDNLICGQAGFAGSTITGARVTLAGKAGLTGHLRVGDDSTVAACAKVCCSLPPKSFVSGDPARPHLRNQRVQAAAQRLPELIREFKEMKKRINQLQDQILELPKEKH